MNLEQKKTWVEERVRYWWDRFCEIYGFEGDCPTVEFSARMTRTSGYANPSRNRIKISEHFLAHEKCEDFDQTIGHEVCHVFVERYYRRRIIHGPEWKAAMKTAGLQVRRCHQYKSAKPRNRQRRYTVKCGCPNGNLLTMTRLRRMRSGWVYSCRRCGERLRES